MNHDSPPIHFIETFGDVAHLFSIGDERKKYVVKFNNYKNRTKEIVNEYIVGKLAARLNLPAIPVQTIYIPDNAIKQLPKKLKKRGAKAGFHLAAPYIEDCFSYYDLPQLPSDKPLLNQDDLAGMIVFDLWVNNTDRSRTNILYRMEDRGFRFIMIDHGRCFPGGYHWTDETLVCTTEPKAEMPVYGWALSHLSKEEDLFIFGEKIVRFKEDAIRQIIQEVPQDWIMTDKEKEQLLQFLTIQKKHLPRLIERFLEIYRL